MPSFKGVPLSSTKFQVLPFTSCGPELGLFWKAHLVPASLGTTTNEQETPDSLTTASTLLGLSVNSIPVASLLREKTALNTDGSAQRLGAQEEQKPKRRKPAPYLFKPLGCHETRHCTLTRDFLP